MNLQDARGQYKEDHSPQRSPKRRREAHNNEELKKRRIQEAMKGVEAQLQKTFLTKIFKSQQDILNLEQVSTAEENQKRRARIRAEKLVELEKRKLDCRVGLLGFNLMQLLNVLSNMPTTWVKNLQTPHMLSELTSRGSQDPYNCCISEEQLNKKSPAVLSRLDPQAILSHWDRIYEIDGILLLNVVKSRRQTTHRFVRLSCNVKLLWSRVGNWC